MSTNFSRSPIVPASDLDWEFQRDNIVRMYLDEDHTLGELRAVMLKNFGFKATVRQYLTRLKRWKAYKNMKAVEKEAVIRKIIEAWTRNTTVNNVNLHGRPVDLHRIAKYCRPSRRNMHAPRQRHDAINVAQTVAKVTGEYGLDEKPDAILTLQGVSERGCSCILGNVSDLALRDKVTMIGLSFPAHRMQPRSLPGKIGIPEQVFELTRIYLHTVQVALRDESSSCTNPTYGSSQSIFWKDVKNAIYMMKTGRADLGWPLLSRACDNSLSDLHDDVSLLPQILSTMSPANTSICAPIRTQILGFLTHLLALRLGGTHPLVGICKFLEAEPDIELHVRTLGFISELLGRSLGQDHGIVSQCRLGQIQTLRRSGDLPSAENLCRAHIAKVEKTCGSMNHQTRRAKSELVHLLKASKEYHSASVLCEEVVSHGREDAKHGLLDACTIYALEDLAELRKQHFDQIGSVVLLREAYNAGLLLWGADSSSTIEIFQKLQTA